MMSEKEKLISEIMSMIQNCTDEEKEKIIAYVETLQKKHKT